MENHTNISQMEQIRADYDINSFLDIDNRNQKKVAYKLGLNSSSINRIIDEARILSLFPNIQKSKAVPLSRIRNNRELKLFAEKYDIYNLQVRQIYTLVKEWRKDIEKNPRMLLNDLQHDLIIGSTIGDANIRQRNKNCSFRVGHSLPQKKYVEWKFEILKEFDNSEIKLRQKLRGGNLLNMFEFSINTHYVFNYYRNLFYKKNGDKVVNEKILNMINPRSLAIWLGDDGSYCIKQKYIIFCTNSFSLDGHKLMKKYFKETWNIDPTIGFRDNKYYYLRFKVDDTKKLVEIVRPFVPKFMKYKLGEENE